MYLSAAQSCDAYWPTELVMFSVKFKSFGFFWKYLKIGYHPKENNVNNIIFHDHGHLEYPHFQTVQFGANILV